ncbi:MAG: NAD(P)H-dependent oxidoreductase [Sphingomonas sp.]|uniref:NADPH-dependent FMN reductase n=1 Tax=Sphingomonas sp. TaxID=28214 RepID=UPI0025FFAFFE|nr:NADPH-dependent FMN reductase [Sphingomonas sp.]MBX3563372.1 NAD(P)H-dependent oxidoreductase [Sphingomonas sp.]
MTEPLKILVILGSVREGRMAAPVGDWVIERAAARADLDCELVDLDDWDLPFFPHAKPPAAGKYQDPLQIRWAEKIAGADGYILICPEYNHSGSAVLKNALDTVFAEWGRKPVSFVGYGTVGGARSVEQLRLTAVTLEMAPLAGAVHLVRPGAKRDGDRFNADSYDDKALAALFDELTWWGRALRVARAGQLPSPSI